VRSRWIWSICQPDDHVTAPSGLKNINPRISADEPSDNEGLIGSWSDDRINQIDRISWFFFFKKKNFFYFFIAAVNLIFFCGHRQFQVNNKFISKVANLLFIPFNSVFYFNNLLYFRFFFPLTPLTSIWKGLTIGGGNFFIFISSNILITFKSFSNLKC